MKLRPPLAFLFAMFFAISLSAQKRLPLSADQHLATIARVKGMNTSELNAVVTQAQDGDREAQFLLALVYERGRLVKKDLTAARTWMSKSAAQGYVPAELLRLTHSNAPSSLTLSGVITH